MVPERDIDFIKVGVTSRDEVIEELGPPYLSFEDLQIIAYSWVVVGAYVPWIIGGEGQAAGGVEQIGVRYVLLIAFDKHDGVIKHEIKERWLFDTIRGHATKWAERENLAVPPPTISFVKSEIPKGKAVIYILRPGGLRDAPLLHQPTVSVDGEVVAELRKGGYVARTLKPGVHTVSVDANDDSPCSVNERWPVTADTFEVLPDTAYFLNIHLKYLSLTIQQPTPVLKFCEADEALPILRNLRPTW
jgi:hypothetical protein